MIFERFSASRVGLKQIPMKNSHGNSFSIPNKKPTPARIWAVKLRLDSFKGRIHSRPGPSAEHYKGILTKFKLFFENNLNPGTGMDSPFKSHAFVSPIYISTLGSLYASFLVVFSRPATDNRD